MNIVTIVQARMDSTRLPNKVIMSLAGKPLLIRQIERIKASYETGTIVVATSTDSSDDRIIEICLQNNIAVFRGDKFDLLDRHYKAAVLHNADAVVKIPSDCPLIDPGIISKVINYYKSNQNLYDYVSNLHPATYPDGNDVEIFSMEVLENAWLNATKNFEREHTTPFIWENPDKFRVGNVVWESGLNYSMTHRWTIDYEEDYLMIKTVYDELYHDGNIFSMVDILNLLDRKPHISRINQKYVGVNWYRHHLKELMTIKPEWTKVIDE
ncbi:MAG: glycosyltransferase family protein [Ignavibacteriaceae bacterium]|nr:glycosyltransferase family protein [Ignavibacteriaceae bacterium]